MLDTLTQLHRARTDIVPVAIAQSMPYFAMPCELSRTEGELGGSSGLLDGAGVKAVLGRPGRRYTAQPNGLCIL